jgi:hypothetical protein
MSRSRLGASLVTAEQHVERELQRLERLGADTLASLRGDDLDVTLGAPSIDEERLLDRIEDPVMADVVSRSWAPEARRSKRPRCSATRTCACPCLPEAASFSTREPSTSSWKRLSSGIARRSSSVSGLRRPPSLKRLAYQTEEWAGPGRA